MGATRVPSVAGPSINPKTPRKTLSNACLIGKTPEHPVDLTDDSPTNSSRKRKLPDQKSTPAKGSAKKLKAETPETPKEKRLRRFRSHAPQAFHDVYARALSQRFFVLSRIRGGSEECPEESIEMTGSTGNIYTVEIGQIPKCTCPHAVKGNQCKHVLYVSDGPPIHLMVLFLTTSDSQTRPQCP